MTTYIALLRAINVGGHRKIKMEDLRKMFDSMGFENVKTYIQSGNVVFSSPETDSAEVAGVIESAILNHFGHVVDVIIRTPEHFKSLTENNPFRNEMAPPFMLYVTFFKNSLSKDIQQKFISISSKMEKYKFTNGELFSLINKKSGQKELFSNNYVEKIAGVSGTTRNWNSVIKITALGSELNPG
jgi:uncharacterized protein (DUF1697 family)